MKDGDRAGVSMFRDDSAYIGIHKHAEEAKLVYVGNVKVGPLNVPVGYVNGRPVALDWQCVSNGSIKSERSLASDRVWLRIKVGLRAAHADGHENDARNATFEYSFDGTTFTQFGLVYLLTRSTMGYIGYRFGLFNFATEALGGQIRVDY
ncbi:hypothetical protein TGAM01_v202097 [Trichoderma gamsii]|uniref:Beta-xylosidase C-terminal Concanavalin A-like domain-containing protein n=1 Tax=Trichoderma gamsii TaxID=398673 RepID=A0A2P4ZXG7_9HYPO|nr:hypothetical protein TGAM01_v202097 [Trichoderma gamsii]PON28989.1 hypothetical protein TGAM01_v202097 [Trichoderma gamsii]